MASKYQKRHYEDVARILSHARAHEPRFGTGQFTATGQAIVDFADLFAADNPLFDRERFLKACGLE